MNQLATPIIDIRPTSELEYGRVVNRGPETEIDTQSLHVVAVHGLQRTLSESLRTTEARNPRASFEASVTVLRRLDVLADPQTEDIARRRFEVRKVIAKHLSSMVAWHQVALPSGELRSAFTDADVEYLLDEASGIGEQSRELILEYMVRRGVTAPAVTELYDVVAYRRAQTLTTYTQLHKAFKDLPLTPYNTHLRDELVHNGILASLADEDELEGGYNALGFYSQRADTEEYSEQLELLARTALLRVAPEIRSVGDIQEAFAIFGEKPSDFVEELKDQLVLQGMRQSLAAGQTDAAWAFFRQRAGTETHQQAFMQLEEKTVILHAEGFLNGDQQARRTHEIVAFIDGYLKKADNAKLHAIRAALVQKYERIHRQPFIDQSQQPNSNDDDAATV